MFIYNNFIISILNFKKFKIFLYCIISNMRYVPGQMEQTWIMHRIAICNLPI